MASIYQKNTQSKKKNIFWNDERIQIIRKKLTFLHMNFLKPVYALMKMDLYLYHKIELFSKIFFTTVLFRFVYRTADIPALFRSLDSTEIYIIYQLLDTKM